MMPIFGLASDATLLPCERRRQQRTVPLACREP
jgi:hypothetical protein